uniref:Protein Wnt n=1 Tax=Thelazia callipaeda TaxID=103827 RepID=A0A0N5CNI4_THECL
LFCRFSATHAPFKSKKLPEVRRPEVQLDSSRNILRLGAPERHVASNQSRREYRLNENESYFSLSKTGQLHTAKAVKFYSPSITSGSFQVQGSNAWNRNQIVADSNRGSKIKKNSEKRVLPLMNISEFMPYESAETIKEEIRNTSVLDCLTRNLFQVLNRMKLSENATVFTTSYAVPLLTITDTPLLHHKAMNSVVEFEVPLEKRNNRAYALSTESSIAQRQSTTMEDVLETTSKINAESSTPPRIMSNLTLTTSQMPFSSSDKDTSSFAFLANINMRNKSADITTNFKNVTESSSEPNMSSTDFQKQPGFSLSEISENSGSIPNMLPQVGSLQNRKGLLQKMGLIPSSNKILIQPSIQSFSPFHSYKTNETITSVNVSSSDKQIFSIKVASKNTTYFVPIIIDVAHGRTFVVDASTPKNIILPGSSSFSSKEMEAKLESLDDLQQLISNLQKRIGPKYYESYSEYLKVHHTLPTSDAKNNSVDLNTDQHHAQNETYLKQLSNQTLSSDKHVNTTDIRSESSQTKTSSQTTIQPSRTNISHGKRIFETNQQTNWHSFFKGKQAQSLETLSSPLPSMKFIRFLISNKNASEVTASNTNLSPEIAAVMRSSNNKTSKNGQYKKSLSTQVSNESYAVVNYPQSNHFSHKGHSNSLQVIREKKKKLTSSLYGATTTAGSFKRHNISWTKFRHPSYFAILQIPKSKTLSQAFAVNFNLGANTPSTKLPAIKALNYSSITLPTLIISSLSEASSTTPLISVSSSKVQRKETDSDHSSKDFRVRLLHGNRKSLGAKPRNTVVYYSNKVDITNPEVPLTNNINGHNDYHDSKIDDSRINILQKTIPISSESSEITNTETSSSFSFHENEDNTDGIAIPFFSVDQNRDLHRSEGPINRVRAQNLGNYQSSLFSEESWNRDVNHTSYHPSISRVNDSMPRNVIDRLEYHNAMKEKINKAVNTDFTSIIHMPSVPITQKPLVNSAHLYSGYGGPLQVNEAKIDSRVVPLIYGQNTVNQAPYVAQSAQQPNLEESNIALEEPSQVDQTRIDSRVVPFINEHSTVNEAPYVAQSSQQSNLERSNVVLGGLLQVNQRRIDSRVLPFIYGQKTVNQAPIMIQTSQQPYMAQTAERAYIAQTEQPCMAQNSEQPCMARTSQQPIHFRLPKTEAQIVQPVNGAPASGCGNYGVGNDNIPCSDCSATSCFISPCKYYFDFEYIKFYHDAAIFDGKNFCFEFTSLSLYRII